MPRGIPHSVFLGWDADDRDKAIWWMIYQRQTCPSCGTRPDQWDTTRGGDPHAYEAQPHHCRGCEVVAQGDEWFEKRRGEFRRGTSMRLVPTQE